MVKERKIPGIEESLLEENLIQIDLKKKRMSKEKKREILTIFILLFPSLLITLLVASFGIVYISGFAIALFFFQAILIKNFVGDHFDSDL